MSGDFSYIVPTTFTIKVFNKRPDHTLKVSILSSYISF